MRTRRAGVRAWFACVLAVCASAAAEEEGTLRLATLRNGEASLQRFDAQGPHTPAPLPIGLQTPLGSLWKLFVHAYVVDRALPDPGYQCSGDNREEIYCCDRGERIERDQALVRSCSLYYAPQRLGITPADWRAYWTQRGAPDWLRDIAQLQPETAVPVESLLQQLATLPAQDALRRVLLDVVVQANAGATVGELGGTLRAKTWSWHRGDDTTQRIGGFAGWLVDGTPVWAQADGTSKHVLSRHGAALGRAFSPNAVADAGECVIVDLFARYPIAHVTRDSRNVPPGLLQGGYRVEFTNGNTLDIESHGDLVLGATARGPTLTARLDREDYVARVLDREAAATPVHAARALAVAIRSYLQQTARRDGDCLRIDDSSATQRVAPRPATPAAHAVAAWTADLVLQGSPVTYHRDTPAPDRLAWTSAVTAANAGAGYDRILADAFPRATLASWHGTAAEACEPIDAARTWLLFRLPQWRSTLDREPGHDETTDLTVCRLRSGRPHVDRAARRIFVRGLQTQQDRLDLVHEYLHLAFAAHPSGHDEAYIESLARRLVLGPNP